MDCFGVGYVWLWAIMWMRFRFCWSRAGIGSYLHTLVAGSGWNHFAMYLDLDILFAAQYHTFKNSGSISHVPSEASVGPEDDLLLPQPSHSTILGSPEYKFF